MTNKERYIVKGTDDFFLHIEDTTFTEDAHEGSIYDIYQVVRRLNKQEEEIQKLKKEILSNKIPTKYYEVWFYQENGFASTSYRVKSFFKRENAKACAKKMNKKNDGIYEVYEKKFADGDIQ